jgi:prevent-host-death family protein
MSEHSIVQAKNQLSELIDRAMGGESVVITRHGHPVAEIKAIESRGRPMTAADVERMRAARGNLLKPEDDPRHIVERMRDEDSERLL